MDYYQAVKKQSSLGAPFINQQIMRVSKVCTSPFISFSERLEDVKELCELQKYRVIQKETSIISPDTLKLGRVTIKIGI